MIAAWTDSYWSFLWPIYLAELVAVAAVGWWWFNSDRPQR